MASLIIARRRSNGRRKLNLHKWRRIELRKHEKSQSSTPCRNTSGRINQGQLIVLEQKIRRRIIVVNVPDAHFRSSETFKRGFENRLFAGGEMPRSLS